ncbi:membrane hypothetical protein [Candidatus Sulfopaludibacter sp. SbA3]|nr:membrane hypothetical protein [Candidatus Sulfopaludibacter sp. SbA3]
MSPSRKELVSLLVPLAAYLLLILLVQPWGNYPLNDDWIYAHIAKKFAESGRFVFDHDTGAAFIGQGLLAAPVIRILGFSHAYLRCLTMTLGALIICLLWLLLRYAEVRPGIRIAALLTVVWNPLFGYLSLSFMTEIYAYFFALLGAVVWMRDRRTHPEGPLVSWSAAIATGLAVGAGFWIRQYSVLVFPALLGATVLTGRRRVRCSLPRLVGSSLVFATVIAGFFLARALAQIPLADYSRRLDRIWHVNAGATFLQGGIFLSYMTAFLLPLLLLARNLWTRRMLPAAFLLGLLGVAAALVLLQTPPHLDLHPRFPFLSNIIRDAGIGPVLFPDVQALQLRSPAWPSGAWGAIECFLLAANVLWAAVIFGAPAVLRKGGLRAEALLFALLFSLASLTVTTFVDRLAAFDRYYLPETFGMAIAVALILSDAPRLFPTRFAVALLPLAFFTIAGLHDYFRWSDAGWDLYREALRNGISPANIQGSYEMNGWHAFDLFQAKEKPAGCIGPCHCDSEWFCLDDSYRIGMNVYGNYETLARRQPHYWLAPGPPVVLSRRR